MTQPQLVVFSQMIDYQPLIYKKFLICVIYSKSMSYELFKNICNISLELFGNVEYISYIWVYQSIKVKGYPKFHNKL